jgi:hypothetical protein
MNQVKAIEMRVVPLLPACRELSIGGMFQWRGASLAFPKHENDSVFPTFRSLCSQFLGNVTPVASCEALPVFAYASHLRHGGTWRRYLCPFDKLLRNNGRSHKVNNRGSVCKS